MASTFTLFRKLPPELRIRIWELALRPFCTNEGGINYISVVCEDDKVKADVNTKPLTVAWQNWPSRFHRLRILCNRAQNGVSSHPSHRSIYLWDSGLLTACKESRYVIMRRYKKYQQSPRLCPWRSEDDEDLTNETPSIEHATDQDEDWQILLQTHRDIPCINFQLRREREDRSAYWVGFELSTRCNFTWSPLMFAMEFDPSWMLNWPDNDFDLLNEASVRGMLARVLVKYLNEDYRCLIWLIDRRAAPQETSASEEAPGKIFYDMEHDYIEPLWEAEDVSEFIHKIGDPAEHSDSDRIHDALWWNTYDYDDRGLFHVEECVKVLVRRRGT